MRYKLSVIIPAYNSESYIAECVASVTDQSVEGVQLICVNDGSTDSTEGIISALSAEYDNIKLINRENGGLSEARNTGMANAEGEYLLFLDSDDKLSPGSLKKLLSSAEKYSPDILSFNAECFPETERYRLGMDYNRTADYPDIYTGQQLLSLQRKNGEYFPNSTILMVRSEFVKATGLCFIPGILHEDNYFTLICFLKAKKAAYCSVKAYQRRIRDDSIMTGSVSFRNFWGYFISAEKLMDEISTIDIAPEYEEEILSVIDGIISNAKNCFRQLPEEEKALKSGLNMKQKILFGEIIARRIKCDDAFKVMHSEKNAFELFKCKTEERVDKWRTAQIGYKKEIEELKKINEQKHEHKFFSKKTAAPEAPVPRKPQIWLIGTPLHGNLGDHRITVSEKEFIRDVFGEQQINEIPYRDYYSSKAKLLKEISRDDLLILQGTGSVGDIWPVSEYIRRNICETWKENEIIIFPSSVYFTDTENGKKELALSSEAYSRENISIILRERYSYETARANFGCKLALSPDMVMYGDCRKSDMPRGDKGILCLRNDKEGILTSLAQKRLAELLSAKTKSVLKLDTVLNHPVTAGEREAVLDEYLKNFRSSRLVVTDRLHGMVFAAITGTPCVAMANSYHKISGCSEWLRNVPYIAFAATTGELERKLPEVMSHAGEVYPLEEMREKFSEMAELCRQSRFYKERN